MPKLEKDCDTLYSLYIRYRDKWTCVMCKRHVPPPTFIIQNSHYWGRNNRATRFDDENCDALCQKCHFTHEKDKQGAYRDFKLEQLGQERYEALRKKANSIHKRSTRDLEELKKQLQERVNQMIYKFKNK